MVKQKIPEENNKVNTKDMVLLAEGILIAFILQLFYDALREDSFYKNLLPIQGWRSILVVICGFFAYLGMRYLKKHSS